jgi:hypothetical protein
VSNPSQSPIFLKQSAALRGHPFVSSKKSKQRGNNLGGRTVEGDVGGGQVQSSAVRGALGQAICAGVLEEGALCVRTYESMSGDDP